MVETDLCVPELIAGCKALGLIDKLVTSPLWRTLEDSNISILKTSDKYAEMERKFIAWSVDSSMLLTGDESLFDDTLVHRDYYLIAIVERRYREISRVHCRVLLRVRSTSNNARGNERVMFPRYRRSTMVIWYLSYIKKYWSFKSSSNTKGP